MDFRSHSQWFARGVKGGGLQMVCLPISPLPHFKNYLFSTNYALWRRVLANRIRQPDKQFMDGVGLRVDIAHGCLDGIVPRHVLQRKGIRVLAGFREEGVA
jgi:hypothetical protein